MTATLVAIQPVLLAVVLAGGARTKLTSRVARRKAATTALGKLIGVDRAPAAYAAVGVVELVVAAALLAGPAGTPVRQAAAVAGIALTAGFLGYLGYLRLFAPDSSCGCLSTRQSPVRWRSFGRGGLLLAAAVLALTATTTWPAAVAERPVACLAALVVELVAVVALSPELDRSWLLPLRKLRARVRPHPLASSATDVPLESTLQQLERSSAYRQVGALLSSDVLDSWDSGDWRIVCYRARRDSGPSTAVFAVPRLRYEPDAVRVVFVDETPDTMSADAEPTVLSPV